MGFEVSEMMFENAHLLGIGDLAILKWTSKIIYGDFFFAKLRTHVCLRFLFRHEDF